jgi:hypothetical protein
MERQLVVDEDPLSMFSAAPNEEDMDVVESGPEIPEPFVTQTEERGAPAAPMPPAGPADLSANGREDESTNPSSAAPPTTEAQPQNFPLENAGAPPPLAPVVGPPQDNFLAAQPPSTKQEPAPPGGASAFFSQPGNVGLQISPPTNLKAKVLDFYYIGDYKQAVFICKQFRESNKAYEQPATLLCVCLIEYASMSHLGEQESAQKVLNFAGNFEQSYFTSSKEKECGNEWSPAEVLFAFRICAATLKSFSNVSVIDQLKSLLAILSNGVVPVTLETGGIGTIELGLDGPSSSEMRFVILEIMVGELLNRGEHASLMNLFNENLKYLKTVNVDRHIRLLLSISRIYMYAGDLIGAERFHSCAENLMQPLGPENKIAPIRLQLNKGLMLFLSSRYRDALNEFLGVCSMCASVNEADVPSDIDIHVIASTAANNAAICGLHVGEVISAIGVIEQTIQVNPARRMNAQVVRNLSILYSLVYSPVTAKSKQTALEFAARKTPMEQI